MPGIVSINNRTRLLIDMQTSPQKHEVVPSLTGRLMSEEAGAVVHGFYSMDYELPGGDHLRLLANHHKKQVQILLISHNPDKLRYMPGVRSHSIIAEVINIIHSYRLRSKYYQQPLDKTQELKLAYANQCIKALESLLPEERAIACKDFEAQELLRQKIITVLYRYQKENHILANQPTVSEGYLGEVLYNALQAAEYYSFNSLAAVSLYDQLDFSAHPARKHQNRKPCFVWDSDLHITSKNEMENAVREICRQYDLTSANKLSQIPANRFERFFGFWSKLWEDMQDFADYLTLQEKPTPKTKKTEYHNGITTTHIKPYYKLQGNDQSRYESLSKMAKAYASAQEVRKGFSAETLEEAYDRLSPEPNESWVDIASEKIMLVRVNHRVICLHYFINDKGQYIPKPCGEDLLTLTQLCERHLYLPERFKLQMNVFITRIPDFFKHVYKVLKTYIQQDLYLDLSKHIHSDHPAHARRTTHEYVSSKNKSKRLSATFSVKNFLKSHCLLEDGQTLESYIESRLKNSNYVIVQPEHRRETMHYSNPFHRMLHVSLEIGHLFIEPMERNPLMGSLAMAAYAYGAGAILAPDHLKALLSKLHLNGLIKGIEPTQELGMLLSNGKNSQAISAAVTYWQAVIVGGDMDEFLTHAIALVKDNPAEVAIITSLAMGLGYGICEGIPAFSEEMGRFPYANYLAAGVKGSIAIHDTVMHPGDDWFLGTCKWLLNINLIAIKLFAAPFYEFYKYGYRDGFLNGWRKSAALAFKTAHQTAATVFDLSLILLSIPFRELSTVLIHIPLRGLSSFFSKSLSALGNWQEIGRQLIYFSKRLDNRHFLRGFRPSPLYGFYSPIQHYAHNPIANLFANIAMFVLSPLFQLCKNAVILPILDILSFTMRLSLELLTPILKYSCFYTGLILNTTGFFWDNSAGLILNFTAKALSRSLNWLDEKIYLFRHWLLSKITVLRLHTYHNTFESEQENRSRSDMDYFTDHPSRLERLPHENKEDSPCLIHTLLSQGSQRMLETPQTEAQSSSQALFPKNSTKLIQEYEHSDKNCLIY